MEPSAEIEAIVRRLIMARSGGDPEVLPRLLSGSEHLRLIGLDEPEWYQGAEVAPVLRATQVEWSAYDVEILRLEAFEAGSVGWAA